jgi:hypothetical protein
MIENPNYEYVKKILDNADAADGNKNRTISLSVAEQYVERLIESAKKLECPEEAAHLKEVLKFLNKLPGDEINVPWYAPNSALDKKLKAKIEEKSPELLTWYKHHKKDHECGLLDTPVPTLSTKPRVRTK